MSLALPSPLILATRQSPLALIQTQMAQDYLLGKVPGLAVEQAGFTTTGDKQQGWSLEKQGGKGLFTKELEEALLSGEAHVAVHSAKDMPTELPEGLTLAGYLPRADARDVLVLRKDCLKPKKIATGSPRRRAQLARIYPNAEFCEIRGRVTTRLEKIVNGLADATIVAKAGLDRLGITEHEGLVFEVLPIDVMVPATGQAAIALECTQAMAERVGPLLDQEVRHAVEIERAFLKGLGGGCHIAHASHYEGGKLHVFHPDTGYCVHAFEETDALGVERRMGAILSTIH